MVADKGAMMIKSQFLLGLALLAGALALPSLACTASNAQFCESQDNCASDEQCLGGVCKRALAAADASVFVTEPDANPPVLCGAGDKECVATAPTGWSGPAIELQQAAGSLPVCPEGFAGAATIGFQDLEAGGSCGCSCSDTSNFACSNAQLEGRDGPSADLSTCFANCDDVGCFKQPLEAGVCTPIQSGVRTRDLLRTNEGVVLGGTCSAGTAISNLETPRFAEQFSYCVAELDPSGCEGESACAAASPPLFEASMCIFQEGEHACPVDSIYSERKVIFDDFQDQRSCDVCECSVQPNTDTCGTIDVFNDDSNCSGPDTGIGLCVQMPSLISPRARFERRETVPCKGTANPPISGQASAVGATTVCCAP